MFMEYPAAHRLETGLGTHRLWVPSFCTVGPPMACTGVTTGGVMSSTAVGARSARNGGAGEPKPVTSSRTASFTVPTLSQKDGAKVADELQRRLVSLADLALTLKHIHWNVVGPNFIAVHQMLDPQYEGV